MKIAGPIEKERVGGNIAVRPGHARAVAGKAAAARAESVAELDYRREPVVLAAVAPVTGESGLARTGDDEVVDDLSLRVSARVFGNVYARPGRRVIVRNRVVDEDRRRVIGRVPFRIDSAALVGAVAGNQILNHESVTVDEYSAAV